jgi:hypothetical protein
MLSYQAMPFATARQVFVLKKQRNTMFTLSVTKIQPHFCLWTYAAFQKSSDLLFMTTKLLTERKTMNWKKKPSLLLGTSRILLSIDVKMDVLMASNTSAILDLEESQHSSVCINKTI